MNIICHVWAAKPANRGTKESIAISRCVFDRYSICYVWYVSAYMFAVYTNHNIVFPESVWAQGSSKSGGLLYIFTCSHTHIFSSSHLHKLTPSHLHIFLPSHTHIFTSSRLLSFTSSHLHTSSHIFTQPHTSSHIFSLSLSPSLSLSCPLSRSLSFFSFLS